MRAYFTHDGLLDPAAANAKNTAALLHNTELQVLTTCARHCYIMWTSLKTGTTSEHERRFERTYFLNLDLSPGLCSSERLPPHHR